MQRDGLTGRVIGCAIEVHKTLGPGLLESAYEQALAYELQANGIACTRQVELPVEYKGVRLDCSYRIDLLVDECLILELKSIDALAGIHEAQLLTYMKVANIGVGLLVNFNVPVLAQGIKRFVL